MPSPSPAGRLTIDGLEFAVRRSPRRRTIGITVERDGTLRLAVPSRCSRRALEQAVHGKLGWVRRKLREFEAMGPPPPPRRFRAGERLPYRGRWYEVRETPPTHAPRAGPSAAVALRRGRFELRLPAARSTDDDARAAFVAWYTAHARVVLAERVDFYARTARVKPGAIRVRDMGRRWGTCDSGGGVLSFHWQSVLLPAPMVDYIVVHELMHLHEPNHGPRFWGRVEAVLPDWRERRRWLRTDAPAYLL